MPRTVVGVTLSLGGVPRQRAQDGQDSPGETQRHLGPGEPRRAQENPGEPRSALESPRETQIGPGEPGRAQETQQTQNMENYVVKIPHAKRDKFVVLGRFFWPAYGGP